MGAVVPMHLYQEVSNEEMRLSYCEYCGATGRVFETHHIKSKGSGGNECRANKINLCVECHEKAQQYVIAPWELIVRVAYREKSTVAEVYAAVGLLLPENIEELEKCLKCPGQYLRLWKSSFLCWFLLKRRRQSWNSFAGK